ncbi:MULTISPECIES: hypothetical protein [Rhodomicrobium]|uniref:hypothetical protein n=1 Tax=Rhodomicrobium TaxID=1068 RepID=UPI000B4AA353|nr:MULTISPECIES: hypothetical protein [Rhodomicrobium]
MAGVDINAIQEGFEVFASDGQVAVGAVRKLPQGRGDIIIYIENAGDFHVPLDAIRDVHSGKVILDMSKLDHKLREAIRHAHDAEDPKIADRTE